MAKATEITGINFDGPPATAISIVLRSRLAEMCLLRKRALDFSDPEGVHDMRVASRRLRSALRDFRPYLRKGKLKPSSEAIRDLADALGAVRDHDVALVALDHLTAKAPADVRAGIESLMEALNAIRSEERQQLTAELSYRGLVALRSSFAATLASALVTSSNDDNEGVSYKDFARTTILARLDELQKLSGSLYQPLSAKPLHKMRIAAKRLRYALELFAPCWAESLKLYARQVALLQTDLGELHDCDVWIENFGKRLEKADKKKALKSISDAERAAMIWLIRHFSKLRARHYRAALGRWHDWERKSLLQNLTATLKRSAAERSKPTELDQSREEVPPAKVDKGSQETTPSDAFDHPPSPPDLSQSANQS
jgi:CHAD domain-containing protein